MACLQLNINSGNILVLGAINNNIDKLYDLNTSQYNLIIVNGNAFNPELSQIEIQKRINIIKSIPKLVYIVGKSDILTIQSMNENSFISELNWILSQPTALHQIFKNGFRLTVMSGGVHPDHKTIKDLNDLNVSIIDKINHKKWCNYYNGRFGRIICNSNSEDDVKIHDFCCHLATTNQNSIYAQEISEKGLGNVLLL